MVFSRQGLIAPGRRRGEAKTRSADDERATARSDPPATRERIEGGGQVPPRRTRRRWGPRRKKPSGQRRVMAPRAPDSAMHRSSNRPRRRCTCIGRGQRGFPTALHRRSAMQHALPRPRRRHDRARLRQGWGRWRVAKRRRPPRLLARLACVRGSARNAASSRWRAPAAAVPLPSARRSGTGAHHAWTNFNRSDMPLCGTLAEPARAHFFLALSKVRSSASHRSPRAASCSRATAGAAAARRPWRSATACRQ